MYRRYYKDVLNKKAQRLATVACILNIVENVALIGLTFIPSAYNYGKKTFYWLVLQFSWIYLSTSHNFYLTKKVMYKHTDGIHEQLLYSMFHKDIPIFNLLYTFYLPTDWLNMSIGSKVNLKSIPYKYQPYFLHENKMEPFS